MKYQVLSFVAASAVAVLLHSNEAAAFGKKRPSEPKDTQAYPTRYVSFGKFPDTKFMLPDGKTQVDMSSVLPQLVLTELAQSTKKLRVHSAGPSEGGETQDRFILVGGMTAFEANAFQGGITIGYKPGVGDIGNGSLAGVEGSVKFNVGTLEMDFNIYDTYRHEYVAVGKGSALTGGVALNVSIDFGLIKTGADFVYNSPMAPHFRAAVRRAVAQIVGDPRTNFLMDWQAEVLGVNFDLKRVFFNAGARDDIAPTNVFSVYDNAGLHLGELKVRDADLEQSSAQFKDDTQDKLLHSVRAGDTVKIFFKTVP